MFYTEHPFVKEVFLLLAVLILEVLAYFLEVKLPFVLLLGPVLLYCKSSPQERKYRKWWFLVQGIPFILFSMGWVLFDEFLLPAKFFSLSIYALTLLLQRSLVEPEGEPVRILLTQLAYIDLIISASFLLLMTGEYLTLVFEISPVSIILALLLLKSALIGRYLYLEWYWDSRVLKPQSDPDSIECAGRAILPESLLKDYETRLNQCLTKNKLYLRSSLSLDLLARETAIPKHHFSTLLNSYIGKSFYQLVAEYRINEAMCLLQKESSDVLTIEALAYECGFNSKSSFNKYFKEMVGCLPSEFRDNQPDK